MASAKGPGLLIVDALCKSCEIFVSGAREIAPFLWLAMTSVFTESGHMEFRPSGTENHKVAKLV